MIYVSSYERISRDSTPTVHCLGNVTTWLHMLVCAKPMGSSVRCVSFPDNWVRNLQTAHPILHEERCSIVDESLCSCAWLLAAHGGRSPRIAHRFDDVVGARRHTGTLYGFAFLASGSNMRWHVGSSIKTRVLHFQFEKSVDTRLYSPTRSLPDCVDTIRLNRESYLHVSKSLNEIY